LSALFAADQRWIRYTLTRLEQASRRPHLMSQMQLRTSTLQMPEAQSTLSAPVCIMSFITQGAAKNRGRK